MSLVEPDDPANPKITTPIPGSAVAEVVLAEDGAAYQTTLYYDTTTGTDMTLVTIILT